MNKLIEFCVNNFVPHKINYEIKYETYFKKGGIVKLYICPNNKDELINIINEAKKNNIKYKVIGLCTNLLILDTVEYGVFISIKNINDVDVFKNRLDVGSGYSVYDLARLMLINGVSGYEGLEGIPGTIGGGVVMNAGAYGYEISDKIIDITFIDVNGNIRTEPKEYFNFSFRNSIFKENKDLCIISVSFDMENNENISKSDIADRMEIFHIARHCYQEFSYPNLGSMFSTKQDMYKEILRNSKIEQLLYWIFKFIFKNPITKRINRKKPSNKCFNKLVSKFHKVEYPLSHKSINILINNGNVSDIDILKHMIVMKELYDKDTHIENEICLCNALNIPPELERYINENKI